MSLNNLIQDIIRNASQRGINASKVDQFQVTMNKIICIIPTKDNQTDPNSLFYIDPSCFPENLVKDLNALTKSFYNCFYRPGGTGTYFYNNDSVTKLKLISIQLKILSDMFKGIGQSSKDKSVITICSNALTHINNTSIPAPANTYT